MPTSMRDAASRGLENVATVMHDFQRPWWVAGGWAVDMFLGSITRSQSDVDIAVLRADQDMLWRYLKGWALFKAISGTLYPWSAEERLELPVHEIRAHRAGESLEFLFNERVADRWAFRRNTAVSMPLNAITSWS